LFTIQYSHWVSILYLFILGAFTTDMWQFVRQKLDKAGLTKFTILAQHLFLLNNLASKTLVEKIAIY